MIRRRPRTRVAIAIASLVAGCISAPLPPQVTPIPTIVPTPSPAPTTQLEVEVRGTIGCAHFPYGCRATLSVLPADTIVPDDWRPARGDPWWSPAYETTVATEFEATPVGALPALPLGRSQVRVLVLGSSDLVSLLPDGTIGEGLLGSCAIELELDDPRRPERLRVTFAPVGGATDATACRIDEV